MIPTVTSFRLRDRYDVPSKSFVRDMFGCAILGSLQEFPFDRFPEREMPRSEILPSQAYYARYAACRFGSTGMPALRQASKPPLSAQTFV